MPAPVYGRSWRSRPEKALAIPNAVLEIEAKPRPILPRAQLVPIEQEIPIRVGLQQHAPDPQLVEQMALRIAQILFAVRGHRLLDQVVDHQGIGIAVAPDCVRRPLRWPGYRPMIGIDGAGIDLEMVGVAQRRIIVWILRCHETLRWPGAAQTVAELQPYAESKATRDVTPARRVWRTSISDGLTHQHDRRFDLFGGGPRFRSYRIGSRRQLLLDRPTSAQTGSELTY